MSAAAARARLEERLRALIGREAKIASHLRGQDGRLEADFEDVVAFVSADEVLEGLEEAALTEIREIRVALERIADGSYETCEGCGGDIGERRLEALPHTRLCVSCASAAEA
ncbi:MAG: TraR/DksA C4-type zinc finger protein [Alphaproteobacteria bacterium]|nr:TraR/DksA C4-type zinc finger protein [Alphaproteobacteria bacterium]MCB9700028.1 TraR/DksA C4-type zinc finger protein [Alphaproteobacteria bacterium]